MKARGIVVAMRTGERLAPELRVYGPIAGQPAWAWMVASVVVALMSLLLWNALSVLGAPAGEPDSCRSGARVGVPKSTEGVAVNRGSSAVLDPAQFVKTRSTTLDISRGDPNQPGWEVG